LKKVRKYKKKYYDKNHRPKQYKEGDLVLVKFPFLEAGKSSELAPKYRGPYKITKKINELNYEIQMTLSNREVLHIIYVR